MLTGPVFTEHGLFPSRESVDECIAYATEVGEQVGNVPQVLTVAMVMFNTMAKIANAEVAKLQARVAQLEKYNG